MWNYRIMRHVYEDGSEGFAIHEVYYTDDGKIWSWTTRNMEPFGDTLQELRNDILRMALALDKPVLDYDMEPEAESPFAAALEAIQREGTESVGAL